MAVLKSGSISKLLENMNVKNEISENSRKPVLLQIRSIIPVLEKDDLWPNRGFYLKVSDLSHATYVSLPHEQDEMILSNKLQLGQFIYVQNFEAALTVPILRGVIPVSGRRICEGIPEDILPVNNLVKFLEAPDTEIVKDKGVISEKKASDHVSDTESIFDCNDIMDEGKSRSLGAMRIRNKLGGLQKSVSLSIENDTDSDSSKSTISSSTKISKRRSWNQTELLNVKEIFDSSMVKKETRNKPRSRSVCASPVRSARDDNSDDNYTLIRRRRATITNTTSVKNCNKIIPISAKTRCEACPKASSERKIEESKIMWDSLPSSLVKLGEDMVRHRDVATVAAAEALQEACAAEKLIKCLSIYSEIKSSKGDDDPQILIDKFFELQDRLSHTRLILQSLTNISPIHTPDSDLNNTGSIKEVLNLAVERKKKATSRIKSAISFDLSPCPCTQKPTKNSSSITKTDKKNNRVINATPIVRSKEKMNSEIKGGVGSDTSRPLDWVKGGSFLEAADVANILHDESRKSFMGYIENFLNEIDRRSTVAIDSDTKIASMMCRIKRVNDWIDGVIEERGWVLGDEEVEACEKIKNKIYSVLLKHVERTAVALENMNKAGQKY